MCIKVKCQVHRQNVQKKRKRSCLKEVLLRPGRQREGNEKVLLECKRSPTTRHSSSLSEPMLFGYSAPVRPVPYPNEGSSNDEDGIHSERGASESSSSNEKTIRGYRKEFFENHGTFRDESRGKYK